MSYYINYDLRERVRQRDNEICVYCGNFGNEIDHIIPRSFGGPASYDNLVTACSSCNSRKHNKFEFKYFFLAFYHLLSMGIEIDWIDSIFPDEEIEDVLNMNCLFCDDHTYDDDFCSLECQSKFMFDVYDNDWD